MKNLFLKFCLLACIPLFSLACSNSKESLIEGIIADVEDGEVIMLFRLNGDYGEVVATDTLKNHRFMFKVEAVSGPEEMSILYLNEGYPSAQSLDFLVAPGKKVKIRGKPSYR